MIVDTVSQLESGDQFIDAPRGTKTGAGTRRSSSGAPLPRPETFVSFNGIWLKLFLGKEMLEIADKWERGVHPRWQMKDGRPEIVRLRAATSLGFKVKTPISMRRHVSLPTAPLGEIAVSRFETTQVESWLEGDEIVVRLPANFSAD
jgi:hypothetical protein